MKHLFLPALLIFITGCKKYEAEYALNCQFPPAYFNSIKRILLVTDAGGKILHELDVPLESTGISQNFTVEGKDLSERYDLHLLDYRDSSNQNIAVYSHFDVPNGASVYLWPESANGMLFNSTFLRIEGIESFDSLAVIGDGFVQPPTFHPVQKALNTMAFRPQSHGMVVRLKANGTTGFRHLYLPADSIATGDTTVMHWLDFKPESNPKTVEIPANVQPYSLMVTAILPGFKSFVPLEQLGVLQSIPPGSLLQFNHPDGLEQPVAYRIWLESTTASFERIFQPGEPLRFDPADLSIDQFSLTVQDVQVTTSGKADLVRVENIAAEWGNQATVFWSMDGSPESLANRTLPNLKGYLPDWLYISSAAFFFRRAGAFQFDNYDYPQVREGFPYKLTEPYARARSGFKAVWKDL